MLRRQFNQTLVLTLLPLAATAQGNSLGALKPAEASQGIKSALEMGIQAAVSQLGKTDGFLGDPKVRIPLPGFLEDAAKLLKATGQGARAEELVTAMNRAAEAAVPMGKSLLLGAVKSMTVTDAKAILSGGDNAVTRFFVEKTRQPLAASFLPVVQKATEQVGLAKSYNRVAGRAASMGLIKQNEANVQQYVTDKTLDALYAVIAEQERALRANPAQAGTALLKKVFGALR
jgi:hypothetical protein